jgi:hypothetical protein
VTEAEWLTATDPNLMLALLKGKVSERKLRLFAVVCCRRGEHHFIDPSQAKAVQTIEDYADKKSQTQALAEAAVAVGRFDAAYFSEDLTGHEASYRTACVIVQAVGDRPLQQLCIRSSPHWLDDVIWGTASAAGYAAIEAEELLGRQYDEWDYHVDLDRAINSENSTLANLLREVVGNLFRPMHADPSWLTSTVVPLASQMYESRDFSPMPILADALQDAGCDNDDILNHCRGPGPHVRGCWAVDAVLGKE